MLKNLYPIIYLDCIVVIVKQDGSIINKSIFLILPINLVGKKELLGLRMAENEGSKFWLSVLTELKNRDVEDTLIAYVNELKGFPNAINAVYPVTKI